MAIRSCSRYQVFCFASELKALPSPPHYHYSNFAFFLFGLGGGAINGATNAVVSDISKTEKGANLSLLGIFFGLGSLGMPLLIGLLKDRVGFDVILGTVGFFTFIITIFFLLLRFPEPKQKQI